MGKKLLFGKYDIPNATGYLMNGCILLLFTINKTIAMTACVRYLLVEKSF